MQRDQLKTDVECKWARGGVDAWEEDSNKKTYTSFAPRVVFGVPCIVAVRVSYCLMTFMD